MTGARFLLLVGLLLSISSGLAVRHSMRQRFSAIRTYACAGENQKFLQLHKELPSTGRRMGDVCTADEQCQSGQCHCVQGGRHCIEPVDGGWSDWSECTATCTQAGLQSRTCTSPSPAWGGAVCQGESTQICTTACAVPGAWSEWGSCSATCGTGFHTRSCINPADGADCEGPSTEECDAGACPVDGGWSEWEVCSVSCGSGGIQTRSCSNPAPANNGADCVGSMSQPCSAESPCPVDGGWTEYGPCPVTCGGGLAKRTCTSPSPANGGAECEGEDWQECGLDPCPVDGKWSDWSKCTVTCGKGGKRSRTCDYPLPESQGKPCDGDSVEDCDGPTCPVNGAWSDWGPCSKPCGGGGSRNRTCSNPAPSDGGLDCVGGTMQKCNADIQCPVDGAWSDWSDCSEKCGGGTRTRKCNNPEPQFQGKSCDGLGLGIEICNSQSCPDCSVSAWSAWGDCSASCGTGTQTRSRQILQDAQGTGAPCPALTASQSCSTPCPCDAGSFRTTPNGACQPAVTYLTILNSDSNNLAGFCPSPNTLDPQDLNRGAGGKYIQACFGKGGSTGSPIANLTVVSGATKQACPAGYTPFNTNLNLGTTTVGQVINLCYQKGTMDASGTKIFDLKFVGDPSSPVAKGKCATSAGWTLDTHDLNDGAKGDYIYMCYLKGTAV